MDDVSLSGDSSDYNYDDYDDYELQGALGNELEQYILSQDINDAVGFVKAIEGALLNHDYESLETYQDEIFKILVGKYDSTHDKLLEKIIFHVILSYSCYDAEYVDDPIEGKKAIQSIAHRMLCELRQPIALD